MTYVFLFKVEHCPFSSCFTITTLHSSATLSRGLDFSKPQFPLLVNGNNTLIHSTGLIGGLKEIIQVIDLALGIQWVPSKYHYLSFSGQWVFWKQHDRIKETRALKSERTHFDFSLCHFLSVWLWTTFFPSLSQIYLICQEGEMYLHCRILVKKAPSPTCGSQLVLS